MLRQDLNGPLSHRHLDKWMTVKLDAFASQAVRIMAAATVLFLVLPLMVTVLMAMDSRSFLGYLPPPELTTKWFVEFFNRREYLEGVKTTAIVGGVSATFSTVAGALAAIGLVRYDFSGRKLIISLIMAPLIVPAVVIGYGMVGWFARLGGIDPLARLIVAHMVLTLPYTIRVITATLSRTDQSLEEAARGLGAGPVRTFLNVTLPMVRPALAGAAVVAFAVSVGEVAMSVFLIDPGTMTLPIVVFSQLRASMTPEIAVASVYLIAVIAVTLYLVQQVYGIERLFGLGTRRRVENGKARQGA